MLLAQVSTLVRLLHKHNTEHVGIQMGMSQLILFNFQNMLQCLTAHPGITQIVADHVDELKQGWQVPFGTGKQELAAAACDEPAYGVSDWLLSCKQLLQQRRVLENKADFIKGQAAHAIASLMRTVRTFSSARACQNSPHHFWCCQQN